MQLPSIVITTLGFHFSLGLEESKVEEMQKQHSRI
jgi:hypothetical protein